MPDMEFFLGKLDRCMAATRERGFFERFMPDQVARLRPAGVPLEVALQASFQTSSPDVPGAVSGHASASEAGDDRQRALWLADEQLARQSVRALFATGSFLDLPQQARIHPGMQERMVTYLPELDDTICTVADRLRDLSGSERQQLQQTLQTHPDLPMDIAAGLDRMAGRTELSAARRAQLRMAVAQVGWRLRKQNPALVIDEYVDKVDRLSATAAIDARLLRRYEAILGQAVIQQAQQTPASQPASGQPSGPGGRNAGASWASKTQASNTPGRSPAERTIARGGKAMGIGLLAMVGGGVIYGAAGENGIGLAGCFGFTSGFVLLVIGFFVFLIGVFQGTGDPSAPAGKPPSGSPYGSPVR